MDPIAGAALDTLENIELAKDVVYLNKLAESFKKQLEKDRKKLDKIKQDLFFLKRELKTRQNTLKNKNFDAEYDGLTNPFNKN